VTLDLLQRGTVLEAEWFRSDQPAVRSEIENSVHRSHDTQPRQGRKGYAPVDFSFTNSFAASQRISAAETLNRPSATAGSFRRFPGTALRFVPG
jgi:hypothetical protein